MGRKSRADGGVFPEPKRVCKVPGCEKTYLSESSRLKRGLCPGHYQQVLRTGSVQAGIPVTRVGKGSVPWGHAISQRARRYGLKPQQLMAMLNVGECDACKTTKPGGNGTWHVDHDHSCCDWSPAEIGKPTCGECNRGILCMSCNAALGNVRDSPTRLLALVEYLEERSSSRKEMGVMP